MCDYVKLISKPNEWFKEGTEVYNYDEDRRITKEEFEEWQKSGIILCRGLVVFEGEEYIDGECCDIDEFTYEYVKESK